MNPRTPGCPRPGRPPPSRGPAGRLRWSCRERAPLRMSSGPRRPAASRYAALLEPAAPHLPRDSPPRRRRLARAPPSDHARLRPVALRRLHCGQHVLGSGRLGRGLAGGCRIGGGRCRFRPRRLRLARLCGSFTGGVPLRPRRLGLCQGRHAKDGHQRPRVARRHLPRGRRRILRRRGIRLGVPIRCRAGPVLLDQRRQRAVGLEEAAARRDEGHAVDLEDAALHGQSPDLIIRRRGERAATSEGGPELAGRQFQISVPIRVRGDEPREQRASGGPRRGPV